MTSYGLDGPGIESRLGRDFPHPSRPALGLTQPHIQWYRVSFPGKSGRGVVVTTHPYLAPMSKSRTIPLRPFWVFIACSRATFTLFYMLQPCASYSNCRHVVISVQFSRADGCARWFLNDNVSMTNCICLWNAGVYKSFYSAVCTRKFIEFCRRESFKT